ncbi:MAG: cyclic nucleotide-binding domain-containing protein [Roseiarcus sp.]|jgi:CRP-like cAMP-binding protein
MTGLHRPGCLMAVPEFRAIAPATRAELAAAMREERFAAGETVLTEGQFADRLFVLCEGVVEVVQSEMPGRRQRLGRGALLGELAFFTAESRTASVRAVTDCLLLSLAYPNFREFLLANPEAALRLAERLAHKLHALEAELAEARQASGSPLR